MEDISMRGAVVRISQDSMEAYLTLQPPEAGEGYTLSELVRYIRTQRVTNGIDEAAIQEMIDGGAVSYTHLDVYKRQGEKDLGINYKRRWNHVSNGVIYFSDCDYRDCGTWGIDRSDCSSIRGICSYFG